MGGENNPRILSLSERRGVLKISFSNTIRARVGYQSVMHNCRFHKDRLFGKLTIVFRFVYAGPCSGSERLSSAAAVYLPDGNALPNRNRIPANSVTPSPRY